MKMKNIFDFFKNEIVLASHFIVYIALLIFVLLLYLAGAKTHAQQVEHTYEVLHFNWNPPTERENGQKITVEELSAYFIEIYDGENLIQEIEIPGNENKTFFLGRKDHQYKILVCDLNGLCSDRVEIIPNSLKPPTNLILR